jgi:hypothetical protein
MVYREIGSIAYYGIRKSTKILGHHTYFYKYPQFKLPAIRYLLNALKHHSYCIRWHRFPRRINRFYPILVRPTILLL